MTAGEVAASLSVLVTIGTGFAGYQSLSEAKQKHETTIVAQGARIEQLELDQARGAGQHALEMKVQELTYRIEQLTLQVQELRKKK